MIFDYHTNEFLRRGHPAGFGPTLQPWSDPLRKCSHALLEKHFSRKRGNDADYGQ